MTLCRFCRARMPLEIEDAIDAGWAPSFYRNGEEIGHPVCPVCQENRLTFNEEFGDFEDQLPALVPGRHLLD